MRFLIDAQLPRKLASHLRTAGHDAKHTLDLPLGNRTPDQVINDLSSAEERIVVSKDADFVNSFWVQDKPWKLLLISTGNIRNDELINLCLTNIKKIVVGFGQFRFIELSRDKMIYHV